MKETDYTNIICKQFCKFYKEGKEELQCRGYSLLKNNFTSNELLSLAVLAGDISKNSIPLEDDRLRDFICKPCEFYIDGCDFTDNRSGPPCGGYLIIQALFRK
jgi:hypothetical protein